MSIKTKKDFLIHIKYHLHTFTRPYKMGMQFLVQQSSLTRHCPLGFLHGDPEAAESVVERRVFEVAMTGAEIRRATSKRSKKFLKFIFVGKSYFLSIFFFALLFLKHKSRT